MGLNSQFSQPKCDDEHEYVIALPMSWKMWSVCSTSYLQVIILLPPWKHSIKLFHHYSKSNRFNPFLPLRHFSKDDSSPSIPNQSQALLFLFFGLYFSVEICSSVSHFVCAVCLIFAADGIWSVSGTLWSRCGFTTEVWLLLFLQFLYLHKRVLAMVIFLLLCTYVVMWVVAYSLYMINFRYLTLDHKIVINGLFGLWKSSSLKNSFSWKLCPNGKSKW